MRLIAYGVGAVGGVVAAHLVESGHETIVVARGEHLDAIRSGGLTLTTPERTRTVDVEAVASAHEIDWREGDVVLLAVKSQDTRGALVDLAAVAPPMVPVACMQNGVANEPAALRWFDRVYGVVVMLPATFLQPGVVAGHSAPVPGLLDLGRWPAGTDDLGGQIVEILASSGFDSRSVSDVARWKYAKLLANLSNVVGAICGPEERGGHLTQMARTEGRRCLDAAGIAYVSSEEDRRRRGDLLDVQAAVDQPRQGSSSWQSLARRTGSIETDFLNGEIVRLGRLHGVPTPVNSLLQRLAREQAQARRPPGSLAPEDIVRQLDPAADS